MKPMPRPLTEEDQARADMYALVATLLLKPPAPSLLAALAAADSLPARGAGHPLDQAWEALVSAAGTMDADAAREEFDALFIGIGTPLLNPYGSRYLTGFMMEKPLAQLRGDLHALGLARVPGVAESEDHLGALCETMRVLIAGAPGALPRPLSTQKTFFVRHVSPWYGRCLDDLCHAAPARFYRCVGGYAQAFLDLEREAFSIDDEDASSEPIHAETEGSLE
ncbi:TorD/DmsD family molecular chaperone [Noviherbaspirillum aridicola]|nr:molecular chaperone TorD family protein [Noviherbaspirillum aridicola]